MNTFAICQRSPLTRPPRPHRTIRLTPPNAEKKSIRERLLGNDIDAVDRAQQIDIDRLFGVIQELQNKVEQLTAEVAQAEIRDRDRMVAVRAMIHDVALKRSSDNASAENSGGTTPVGLVSTLDDSGEQEPWEYYRNSFTMTMSRAYLQTVDQLRDSLMASEWELGMRPMALLMGVSRFEAYCASNKVDIPYSTISQLYDDPTNLSIIEDPHVRMQARSCIMAVESEQRIGVFNNCTVQAQKLGQQFSEAEFISKIIPDPLETGVMDSLRKIAIPMAKMMGK